MENPHWGMPLDAFLTEAGIRAIVCTEAATGVIARQPAQEMARQGISKTKLATLMQTSRNQVDRILNAKGNVTIDTLLVRGAGIAVGVGLRMGGMGKPGVTDQPYCNCLASMGSAALTHPTLATTLYDALS